MRRFLFRRVIVPYRALAGTWTVEDCTRTFY